MRRQGTSPIKVEQQVTEQALDRGGRWVVRVQNDSQTKVSCVFAGTALADDIPLDMEGTSTATIPKGNTVTRKITGIPAGIPGTLKLKLKWHAVSLIPNTFNQLRIELKHGSSTVIAATNCFSFHSNKTPKCTFDKAISVAEANRAGDWNLTVTNNSDQEVIGFNIARESGELNPLVPNFRSVYTPDCPDTVNLDMEGTTLTLTKGSTQSRAINGVGNADGVMRLKLKWHAVAPPQTFNFLKVEVLNGSDSVKTSTCFSIHSNKTPKCDFTIDTGGRPGNQWKLRITNNSNYEVIGFNIQKESTDPNPLVPRFNSTYKANCQF
ncbi:MAG: hypothetical protein LC776_03500 [Acidobacteria bacterium]|nr:hypothetical protein [Acidobacteriota bacterium]